MTYIGAIIGYMSWPFMIAVSYIAIRLALSYFEKRLASESDK